MAAGAGPGEPPRGDIGQRVTDLYGPAPGSARLLCNASVTLLQIASLAARVGLTPCGEKDETIPLEVSEEMVKSAGCIDTRR